MTFYQTSSWSAGFIGTRTYGLCRRSTGPGSAIHYFASRFGVQHEFLVVGDLIEAGIAGDVRSLDASAFLAALPV